MSTVGVLHAITMVHRYTMDPHGAALTVTQYCAVS